MPEAVPLANPPNPFGSIHSSVECAKSFIVVNVATQGRVSAGRGQAGRAWVNLQFESDLSWPGYLVEKMRIVFYWTNEVDDRKHKVLCLLRSSHRGAFPYSRRAWPLSTSLQLKIVVD